MTEAPEFSGPTPGLRLLLPEARREDHENRVEFQPPQQHEDYKDCLARRGDFGIVLGGAHSVESGANVAQACYGGGYRRAQIGGECGHDQ